VYHPIITHWKEEVVALVLMMFPRHSMTTLAAKSTTRCVITGSL
jgi:hypothetical protein